MYQKRVKNFLVLLFFLTGCCFTAFAQDNSNTIGQVSISSPTAASLGKYGDIPVSYNTGIPQINIPIYSVNSGSLKLPISLSYHASGLKVQEQASWVGAGWSLNAGGVITRTVVGAPDDRGYQGYQGFVNACTNGHYSDTGFNSYLFYNTGAVGACGVTASDYYEADDAGFENGYKDGEPDLYFFNFGNYSGKFYFNDDRTPILVPEQDFKIQPDFLLGPGFRGFIITTPDGVRYYFGQTGNTSSVNPIEATIPSTLQNGPSTANAATSSWYLNKVISADGMDSISLSYQPESYSYYTVSMFPVLGSVYNSNSSASCGYNLVKNFVQGVRLSQVAFPNGTVTFTAAATPRTDLSAGYAVNGGAMNDVANTSSFALGSITIADNKGFCKKDSLYYGYFYDNNASGLNPYTYGVYHINSDAYRLRLDSVQEISCDGSIKVPSHKFSYFSEQVPRKLSFGIDHWGFSNGATGNNSLVPTYTIVPVGGPINGIGQGQGANRDAAWPAMRGGTLQQITYPTGGYTQFDYDANDTYAQYNLYIKKNLGGFSVGYGNQTNQGTFITDNSSNVYELDMQSDTLSGGARLIFSAGGNWSIDAAKSKTYFFSLPSNTTETWTFYDEGANTYDGSSAAFFEWVPTPVSGNVMVGGLRIKTITHNDGITSTSNITSYTYNTGGSQSSGILYSRPTYLQVIRNDIWGLVDGPYCSTGGCASCDGTGAHNYYISPSSIRPMATVQGNHIGYNQVQVTQAGNGYSIYRYYGSNAWDYNISDVCIRTLQQSNTCDPTIPNFPAPPLPFEYMRGELKYEGHFNEGGHILKDAWYFPVYKQDPLTTPGQIYVTMPGMYSYTGYNLQSAYKVKDSVVGTTYDPSSSNYLTTTNTTYYGSAFHHQPTRKVTSASTGDSLITNIKYAYDFRLTSCDAIPDSLPYYIATLNADSSAMLNSLATCSPQVSNCNNCRYANFQQYRRNINLARINFINYRRRSFSRPGSLVSACYATAEGTADTLLKPILRLQDEYNNTSIEVSEWKNLNLRHATFTKYDTSVSPVGFAYPGRVQSLFLQAPSATFTNATVSGNTVSKDSRYADETVFKFSAGNPQQVTGHDGVSNSYLWDYQNTEPIAKVVNATVDQVAYTSFEADGSGSWAIGSASRDAVAITGTQSYNLANGACSRSGLTSANTYIVSYWTTNAAAYTITGTQGSAIQGRTSSLNGNSWTYFEHKITGQTSISITGTGDIDELRLYPATAQMTTYSYQPVLGMNSTCDAANHISYYEYDKLGRLLRIRDMDNNVLKQYEYQYQVNVSSVATWQSNGQLRCKPCPANASYITNMQQHQEIDINSGSATYNTSRWVDDGIPGSCVISPDWENTTTAIRCQQSSGSNDGYQEQQQEDMNPCSSSYDSVRWVTLSLNATACPYCNSSVCSGPSHKCFGTACQTGTLGIVSQTQTGSGSTLQCTTQYGYFFSDGSYLLANRTVTSGQCLQQ